MKFWVRFLVAWLVIGSGLRAVLLVLYPAVATTPGLAGFAAGVVNDLQAFWLAAGMIAVFGLGRERWLRAGAFIVLAVTLLVSLAEVFFWIEFESRLDRLVFHYLSYPKEVIVFLEDQFYLSLFVLPFLGISWLLVRMVGWPRLQPGAQGVHVALIIGGILAFTFAQPVGGSNSRVASQFASNGYLGMLTAARYDVGEVEWLARSIPPRPGPSLTMPVKLRVNTSIASQVRRELTGKRHVVLIIEESFAGPVWDDLSKRQRYMPNLAKLAESSVAFSHLYATGNRTTRGLEALLNGFPPLPGISVTQRQHFERLPSLARGFIDGGYHPVFLYGGWPDFSDFSNYWQALGFRKIWTREDFDEDFETSWGVADGALFSRLVAEMSLLTKQHDRVFLATLTVSHHRPYDFPAGTVDFPASERRSEYALAYADQALGDFFAAAAKQPWYQDTLFVIVADHGVHPRGDALIPANSYHIPLLLRAQGLQPRRMTGLGSSMSLPKTLMSALQIKTNEGFAGQDLLCQCDTVVPVEYGYHIGLLDRDRLRVVTAQGKYASWHFDVMNNQLVSAVDARGMESAQRVISAFAPAYQWFYGNDSTDVDNAQIVRQQSADLIQGQGFAE